MIDSFKHKNWMMEGFFRMTGFNPETKESRIFVDKKNSIMYDAPEIVSRGLAGLSNAGISHLYLAYSNNNSWPGESYVIDPSVLSFDVDTHDCGCLRIPLTFPAVVTTPTTGTKLISFNILVNQPIAYSMGTSIVLTDSTSKFFEAGLVAQTTAYPSEDLLLARVAFSKLTYDEHFNLTISWGIKLSV